MLGIQCSCFLPARGEGDEIDNVDMCTQKALCLEAINGLDAGSKFKHNDKSDVIAGIYEVKAKRDISID